MNLQTHQRAALAVCLVVTLVGSVAAYLFLNFFFELLISTPGHDSKVEDIISAPLLYAISGLLGILIAFLLYRPTVAGISQYGLPGMIPAADPLSGKHIRCSFFLPSAEHIAGWEEHFAMWVSAPEFASFFTERGGSVSARDQEGKRLIITYPNTGEDTFMVKLQKGRRVIANLEVSQGVRGSFTTNRERKYSECSYQLSFVGCEGEANGWLKFWGEERVMRLIFLK